jgi:arylformamidase
MYATSPPVIHDITFGLSTTLTVWPKDTPVRIERIKETGDGARSTVSKLILSSHAGSHVDAPMHFVPGGGTVESLELSTLIGDALVVEVSAPEISRASLDGLAIPEGAERLIFKTANSRRFSGSEPFFEDYVGVTRSGAEWLLERGVKLAGVDYLSVAAHRDILDVHQILLGEGVVLLETLDLRDIRAGWYQLVCLPLKLDGADGAPARAVLIEQ